MMEKIEERYYDQTARNPRGTKEDATRCIETVQMTYDWHFPQCSRKRGYGPDGLYCKQHAKRVKGSV